MIVTDPSALEFGRVIFGVSEPVRRTLHVRGVDLMGNISLSLDAISGFDVVSEIPQTEGGVGLTIWR